MSRRLVRRRRRRKMRNEDSGKKRSWSNCLKSVEELITRSGVPRWVIVDERAWARFVSSGYAVSMENGWFFRIDMLTEQQVYAAVELMLALGAYETDVWCSTAAHPLKDKIWAKFGLDERRERRDSE